MKYTLDGNPSNGASILLPPPTLCLRIAAYFFFLTLTFPQSSRPYPGHIRCRTEGLAQHKVHRIRSAIPKFLFAAQALTLLCHEEFDQLIWVNQVK